jgi:hypothetical protein
MNQKQAASSLRWLYPVWLVVSMFGLLFVRATLINPTDAAATIHNLQAHETLFRLGIASNLLTQLLFIVVVLVLFKLFASVNKTAAALMVILALVSVPLAMGNELNQLAALPLLGEDPGRVMFYVSDLYKYGLLIVEIFWGLWLFPLAYLIRASEFFPKWLGTAVGVAGAGYLVGTFTQLLFPSLTGLIAVANLLTLGEVIFVFWILFKGIKT